MTSARAIEYRITRQLTEGAPQRQPRTRHRLAEQLIAITAIASGLLLFGSYFPELVVAGIAGSAVWAMGGASRSA
ncbi:hypothetical protein E2F43_10595 [Seongchinamella unica]|uniref:Uncharacterized protein n=1 Tax=Seongchinamella unica TaxID=2547392 RepID=A0A4R5LT59_9GAMM|nr:hypothetical protein [Seongchinamella unica]TDG13937.1 hypothetical protein E2F43_10595 [Seongchinamella unica]